MLVFEWTVLGSRRKVLSPIIPLLFNVQNQGQGRQVEVNSVPYRH